VSYGSSVLHHPGAQLRRAVIVIVASLCLLVPTTLVTSAASAAGGGYDNQLSPGDCELLGRVYSKGAGCARTRCVSKAHLYRKVYGAEACQLRGQGEYGYVSTIDWRRCAALSRRWIASVNYCASYPDRSATAVYDAPQCTGPANVYVTLSEKDGYYDECLTPARVKALIGYARSEGSTLEAEASLRSDLQCQFRPESAYVDGKCVSAPGSRPATGGIVMVGDSLTWRGTDELSRLRGTFTIDGEPARQISELRSRLDDYQALYGVPKGVIVALGAVPPPKGFGKSDLAKVIKGLPSTADVMFVMPYAELVPGKATKNTQTIVGWMKSIAKGRRKTCLADWPSYVRGHQGILQDGVHVKHSAEGGWARFIDQSWSRCF